MAGAPTSIRIRGINTLFGGAEPLYVIDGVPNSFISSFSTFYVWDFGIILFSTQKPSIFH